MEVKTILEVDSNPTNAMSEAFPPPQPKKLDVPPYNMFYRPEGTMMTKVDINFTTLIDERRWEVLKHNFNKHNMEAWWRMRWYLGVKNIPYEKMP
jgi:hypothetical protein